MSKCPPVECRGLESFTRTGRLAAQIEVAQTGRFRSISSMALPALSLMNAKAVVGLSRSSNAILTPLIECFGGILQRLECDLRDLDRIPGCTVVRFESVLGLAVWSATLTSPSCQEDPPMALWHDPLDELIADLERVIPPKSTTQETDYQASLIGMQLYVSAILWGLPAEVARVERDPRVQAFLASLDSLRLASAFQFRQSRSTWRPRGGGSPPDTLPSSNCVWRTAWSEPRLAAGTRKSTCFAPAEVATATVRPCTGLSLVGWRIGITTLAPVRTC
jgi:hypothetical protein